MRLSDDWTPLLIGTVFGWPAAIAAMFMFWTAVRLRRPAFAFAAVVVSAPFCLFVSGYPLVGWWGNIALGSNAIGAVALLRGAGAYSLALWVPFALLVGWLAIIVVSQPN